MPTREFCIGDDILFTLRFSRFPDKWSDDTGWDDPRARFAVRTQQLPFGSNLADPGAGKGLFVSPPMVRKARLDGSFAWCFQLTSLTPTTGWGSALSCSTSRTRFTASTASTSLRGSKCAAVCPTIPRRMSRD